MHSCRRELVCLHTVCEVVEKEMNEFVSGTSAQVGPVELEIYGYHTIPRRKKRNPNNFQTSIQQPLVFVMVPPNHSSTQVAIVLFA